MERSVRILVQGKVQGVYFRKHTQRQAKLHCLKGWVRNQTDGSVLIEVLGDQLAVGSFIEWCRQGSPAADVQAVQVEEIPPFSASEFEIR